MDPSQDFKALQDKIQASLLSTTRTVNRIASEDLGFQRTINPTTGDRLEEQSARLLSLSSNLLKAATKVTDQKRIGILEDAEDVDIQWHGIVDAIDGLLEKADICLDEYTGLVKRKSDFPGPAPVKKAKTNEKLEWNVFRANIIKPQNAFEKKVDNFAPGPWKPQLTQKPHATVPLEQSLGIYVDECGNQQYKHPYEKEILDLKYPASTYEKRDPIPYQPIEKTSAIWVDTYEGVLAMLEELKQATEIAVDLEHHDYRSYHGLLSLMQISTREKDWVIDTLRPWRHKLEVLNEVFADPKILKVFHGAFMDIIWLQRDLGLYIVGLFDTYQACVVLDYSGKSLAYLLKTFVDFEADKKYQMADWRIRPLTGEMLYYARSDTHYLLYVYDCMRNELVSRSDQNDPQKNLIETTLQKSKEVSLDRYIPMAADPSTGAGARGWANSLQKSFVRLDGPQFAVYRAVHKWRDDMARQDDENPAYIMPQQTVMEIAKILPTDPKALWSLLGNRCSQKVKQSLDELFHLVTDARKSGAEGPSSTEHFKVISQNNGSVADVARREFGKQTKPQVELPSVDELRSKKSQLFGSIPMSSLWEQSVQAARDAGNRPISLPWTAFIQDAVIAAKQEEAKAKSQKNAVDVIPLEDSQAPPSKTEPVVDNTEFTLRQGRKRKIDHVEASDHGVGGGAALETEDVISLNVDETKEDRNARRKAYKKAKKQWKESKREGAAGGVEDDDEAPFDYSKAQSVLHAQRTTTAANTNSDSRGKKKAFDPYAARMNAEGPKAARRMHSERSGKTATFKK